MIPSKVTISQDTLSRLNSRPLSAKRKREIRVGAIKQLIESHETGHKFSVADLVTAAGYKFTDTSDNRYSTGAQFVRGLVRRGVLIKVQDEPGWKASYYITNESIHGRPIRKKNIVKTTLDELAQQKIKDPDLVQLMVDSETTDKNLDEAIIEFNDLTKKEDDSCYSFSFTLEKRGAVESGKQTMTSIQLNDVTLAKTKDTLQYLINNFENIT